MVGGILSKEALIQWVKESQQPGPSPVVASQQPSALDMEVLSQCEAVDKVALNRLTKDYMGG